MLRVLWRSESRLIKISLRSWNLMENASVTCGDTSEPA